MHIPIHIETRGHHDNVEDMPNKHEPVTGKQFRMAMRYLFGGRGCVQIAANGFGVSKQTINRWSTIPEIPQPIGMLVKMMVNHRMAGVNLPQEFAPYHEKEPDTSSDFKAIMFSGESITVINTDQYNDIMHDMNNGVTVHMSYDQDVIKEIDTNTINFIKTEICGGSVT